MVRRSRVARHCVYSTLLQWYVAAGQHVTLSTPYYCNGMMLQGSTSLCLLHITAMVRRSRAARRGSSSHSMRGDMCAGGQLDNFVCDMPVAVLNTSIIARLDTVLRAQHHACATPYMRTTMTCAHYRPCAASRTGSVTHRLHRPGSSTRILHRHTCATSHSPCIIPDAATQGSMGPFAVSKKDTVIQALAAAQVCATSYMCNIMHVDRHACAAAYTCNIIHVVEGHGDPSSRVPRRCVMRVRRRILEVNTSSIMYHVQHHVSATAWMCTIMHVGHRACATSLMCNIVCLCDTSRVEHHSCAT